MLDFEDKCVREKQNCSGRNLREGKRGSRREECRGACVCPFRQRRQGNLHKSETCWHGVDIIGELMVLYTKCAVCTSLPMGHPPLPKVKMDAEILEYYVLGTRESRLYVHGGLNVGHTHCHIGI